MFAPNSGIAMPEVVQLVLFMEQLGELGAFGIYNRFYLLIFDGEHGGKILVCGLLFMVSGSKFCADFIDLGLL